MHSTSGMTNHVLSHPMSSLLRASVLAINKDITHLMRKASQPINTILDHSLLQHKRTTLSTPSDDAAIPIRSLPKDLDSGAACRRCVNSLSYSCL